jgi:hypothetical protein
VQAHALAVRSFSPRSIVMAKTLSQFTVSKSGEDYLIRIESDDGESAEFGATYEQLDLISEAIDEQLDADEEEALAVEGE